MTKTPAWLPTVCFADATINLDWIDGGICRSNRPYIDTDNVAINREKPDNTQPFCSAAAMPAATPDKV